MYKKLVDIEFVKGNGLVPVIVQDIESKDILTLAYSNKESLSLTIQTGNSWFWSRSRNKLWMKGETSGNIQNVKKILVDCDCDAVIYLVDTKGPACHTQQNTCFHNELK
ncbi:MAG: phosphoribosyl-AMP cyclohydrolase [Thaumarchaeota archaeon]|nr:phosphoribosyl-AMP cyclohydrolase [Nitrososphaerota archaeon]MCY3976115.1 phosphoribosyl-AMP cyclohydrolase [Nitrososphaerota archaeon]